MMSRPRIDRTARKVLAAGPLVIAAMPTWALAAPAAVKPVEFGIQHLAILALGALAAYMIMSLAEQRSRRHDQSPVQTDAAPVWGKGESRPH